ncbi:MAG: winged helix-turn-helix domain-containing protein, partial [Paracoccaceae bacterium]
MTEKEMAVIHSTDQIGDLRFDLQSHDLLDASGIRVKLRNKSLEVLACLAKRRGQVLTKSEIIESVWPDVTVSDESLTQCIAEIRRAIRDREQTLLTTHIGRGYCLEADQPSLQQRHNWKKVAAVGMAIAAAVVVAVWLMWPISQIGGPPRIAVLAFDDLSASEDSGYLGDGVAEGLLTELSRYRELAIIARNSSFSFRDSGLSISEIANKLRADYVIEGSKQKADNRLKVTVQLINGNDGTHVWAEEFEADIGELFDVQNRIVREVTNKIGREVTRKPPLRGGREAVGALHTYFKGMQHFQKDTIAETLAARELFNNAVKNDPTAPYGYIGLTWVHWRDLWSNEVYPDLPRDEKLAQAEALAAKALTLDPEYHLAHVARADVHVAAGELEEAVVRYSVAGELNPNDVLVMVGATDPLVFLGQAEEAIALLKKAIDLDPVTPGWYFHQLGWAQWSAEQCDDGLETMMRMPSMPNSALRVLAALQVCNGDTVAAKKTMQRFRQANPARTVSEEIEFFG